MAHQQGYVGTPIPGSWTEMTEEELAYITNARRSGVIPGIARQAGNAQAGRKFDQAKPDYTLLPWDAVEQIVRVLDFGAQKYARDNWKHVDNAETRYLAAAFRHLSAYTQGEVNDSETGLSHLAHAGCCLLFLMALPNKEQP